MRLYFVKPVPRPWQWDTRGGLLGLGSAYTVTPGMQAVASAIQTQEGYAPGTLAYQNNNPGNLIYAGQPGATPGAGGFAAFPTYQDGLNALYNQINLYATGACGVCGGQPMTVAQMTAVYAPAGQGSNNPTVYANNIASATGTTPDTPLSDILAGTVTPATMPVTAPSLDLTGDTSGDGSTTDLSSLTPTDNTTLYLLAAGVAAVGLLVTMER